MKKSLFICLLLLSQSVFSQNIGIGMKGFIENYYKKSQSNFPNKYSIRDIDGLEYLSAIIKVNSDFQDKSITEIGCRIGSKFGNIYTIYIPVCRVSEVIHLDNIIDIETSRKINGPQLHKATNDVSADLVWQGFELPQGYSGKGVIIGVTDWGFDYTHPMFYDTAMNNYRILGAWDQFRSQGPPPDSMFYGTVFYGEQELTQAQSDTINIYKVGTHGTHVSGIAAGGGAGTQYRGVAYDSELLMATFLIDEVAVLDAYAWMRNEAKKRHKRLVVNGSWGLYHFGMMDGTSLLDQAVKQMSDVDSVVFVTSGGNNGNNKFHVKKAFTNNDTLSTGISFDIQSQNANYWGQTITMAGDSTSSFSSRIEFYNSFFELVYSTPWMNTQSDDQINDTCVIYEGDSLIFRGSSISSTPISQRPIAEWEVRLSNYTFGRYFVVLSTTSNQGIVHAWNVACLNTGVGNWGIDFAKYKPYYLLGDSYYGVGEPAVGDGMISVAAYNSQLRGTSNGGARAGFSSIGPRIDGAIRPEIAAPGVAVISSISSYSTETYPSIQDVFFNDRTYSFSALSGTSMSSPMVSGIVALMLEANPKLTPMKIKEILKETARMDNYTTSTIPNNSWGWGKVSAHNAVKRAVDLIGLDEVNDDIRFEIYPNPVKDFISFSSSENINLVEIFDLFGRKQISKKGNTKQLDVSSLKKGMYILSINLDSKVLRYKIIKR
ncbi:MAG: S8 family peptidase [Bacteroidales bacterium]|jgi:subtilisin family serine protease|nr:S8 family peptidase [Bacteroidales bacterium]MDX9798646.1 S8 family peptidase [Bacteroidales bacterium]